ncbi:hypothetical protein CZ787_04630 [Halomonas citrativorans]|uniref:Uncharacterized protein n=1 Tax=Halomonas citrativorans TaxID=2742612 RepID=A0A1R4HTK7_9GAMM|nr:hypothetical protein CZ787_04630 [Halomonas citrativorans]
MYQWIIGRANNYSARYTSGPNIVTLSPTRRLTGGVIVNQCVIYFRHYRRFH